MQGYEHPMRSMTAREAMEALPIILSVCASVYCGMQEHKSDETYIQACIEFIRNHFKMLGVNEIKTAFEMAAAKKFDKVDITAYWGTFTVSMLGNILTPYLAYRNRVIQQIEEAKQKLAQEEERAAKHAERKEEARTNACHIIAEAIARRNSDSPMWAEWQQIPINYSQIALEEGQIAVEGDKKKEIWMLAKELATKEIHQRHEEYTQGKRAAEAREMRTILNQLQEGIATEAFNNARTAIYAKLLLWEFVKPDKT